MRKSQLKEQPQSQVLSISNSAVGSERGRRCVHDTAVRGSASWIHYFANVQLLASLVYSPRSSSLPSSPSLTSRPPRSPPPQPSAETSAQPPCCSRRGRRQPPPSKARCVLTSIRQASCRRFRSVGSVSKRSTSRPSSRVATRSTFRARANGSSPKSRASPALAPPLAAAAAASPTNIKSTICPAVSSSSSLPPELGRQSSLRN